MIRLANPDQPTDISIFDMKDGDVGVIVQWDRDTGYNGRIVQRYKDALVVLGKPYINSWPDLLTSPGYFLSDKRKLFRVRLLEDGETLVFTKD